MISFEAQKLPPYLGGAALAAITIKMGIEGVSNFSKALFREKIAEGEVPLSRSVHFWRGIKCLIPMSVSAFSLYLLSRWARTQIPKEEAIIGEDDFLTCKNELKEFQKSAAYSDLIHPPGIEKFCTEYLISLEAYTNFLSQGSAQDGKLQYWTEQIQPYFSFLKWKEKALDLSKKTFDTSFKTCEEKFNWVRDHFTEEVLVGIKVDWPSICDQFSGERFQSCEKYLKMKKDLEKFRRKGVELNTLASKINDFYKVSKCGEILKLSGGESKPLESDFKQIICSKLPFNQTSLCTSGAN